MATDQQPMDLDTPEAETIPLHQTINSKLQTFFNNDAINFLLEDLSQYLNKSIKITCCSDDRCFICVRLSNDPVVVKSTHTFYYPNFSRENLEYLKKSFRCRHCQLLNVSASTHDNKSKLNAPLTNTKVKQTNPPNTDRTRIRNHNVISR